MDCASELTVVSVRGANPCTYWTSLIESNLCFRGPFQLLRYANKIQKIILISLAQPQSSEDVHNTSTSTNTSRTKIFFFLYLSSGSQVRTLYCKQKQQQKQKSTIFFFDFIEEVITEKGCLCWVHDSSTNKFVIFTTQRCD